MARAYYPCGCSRQKVEAGLCSTFDEQGEVRRNHSPHGPDERVLELNWRDVRFRTRDGSIWRVRESDMDPFFVFEKVERG